MGIGLGWMGLDGLVIIGHWSSESTFGSNKKVNIHVVGLFINRKIICDDIELCIFEVKYLFNYPVEE